MAAVESSSNTLLTDAIVSWMCEESMEGKHLQDAIAKPVLFVVKFPMEPDISCMTEEGKAMAKWVRKKARKDRNNPVGKTEDPQKSLIERMEVVAACKSEPLTT